MRPHRGIDGKWAGSFGPLEQRAPRAQRRYRQRSAIAKVSLLPKIIIGAVVVFVAVQVFGFVAGVVALAMK